MNSTAIRSLFALTAIVLLTLATSTSSSAGEPRTHDGFFLRLSGGGGYAKTTLSNAPVLGGSGTADFEMSGSTGDLNFAIGTTVATNLILHGTVWGWLVDSPDVEQGTRSGTASDATLDMTGFGVGITYYFMPANIYISPSVGGATMSVEENNVTFSTDTGFSFDLTIGKEWWVGDGWAIGAAGGFSYHSIPDGDIDENWGGSGFALRFTATMN